MGSVFMGVIGGVSPLIEYELARDLERVDEAALSADFDINRWSEELGFWELLLSATRIALASAVVRNWRIWLLRFSKSSRVIPKV